MIVCIPLYIKDKNKKFIFIDTNSSQIILLRKKTRYLLYCTEKH